MVLFFDYIFKQFVRIKKATDRKFLLIFFKQIVYWVMIPIAFASLIGNFHYGKVSLEIESYRGRVYSDRNYSTSVSIPEFSGLKVVLIPRHIKYDINLSNLSEGTTIFRMLSDKNDNSGFYLWEKADIAAEVKGQTCTLTSIVKKKIDTNQISLSSGGPLASSPIIVLNTGDMDFKADYNPTLLGDYYPKGIWNYVSFNASIDKLFRVKLIGFPILYLILLLYVSYRKRMMQ